MKAIKMMVRFDGKLYEAKPNSRVPVSMMMPVFWDEDEQSYGSIPNVSAESVYDEWLAQWKEEENS